MSSADSRRQRYAALTPEFIEHMRYWAKADARMLIRILDLVEATVRDPRAGLGKPEPLRHRAKGSWSRRITGEHRLTYVIFDDRVEFLQCRYHYER